jgi:ABC-2 type transport system permease protein
MALGLFVSAFARSEFHAVQYAFDALDRAASGAGFGGRGWLDVAVMGTVTLLALGLGALTLRRRTP